MELKSPSAHRRAHSVDHSKSSSTQSTNSSSSSSSGAPIFASRDTVKESSTADQTRTINRDELERFVATRKLPENILQQLRSRVSAPSFKGFERIRSQSTDAILNQEQELGPSGKSLLPGPMYLRKVDDSVIDREAKGLPLERRDDSRMRTLGPEILRKPSSRDSSAGKQRSGGDVTPTNSVTPIGDEMGIVVPANSGSSSTAIGSTPATSTGPSPLPSPRGGSASGGVVKGTGSGISIDLNALTPAHKLPFSLESHTQQGIDEFHSEENQDRHCFGYDFQRQLAWLGISDGHVGSGAADYIARNVIKNIQSCQSKGPPQTIEDLTSAIAKGIKLTEERFKKQDDASGACLVLACLWARTLVIANVGDSRAVIGTFRSGAIAGVQLTVDHNVTTEGEAKLARYRFLKNQGALKDITDPSQISNDDLVAKIKELLDGDDIIAHGRVFTSECTRTIGDFGLKKACYGVIVAEPEFTVVTLSDADHHLILACDGIWKTVSSQRAAEIVNQAIAQPNRFLSPAEKLIREAVEHGSGDDQTCLVLDLVNYKNCLSQTTDIASKIFKGLSVFDNCTAQEIASSAHRTFQAKMARMNARGELSNTSKNTRGVFEMKAQQNQAFISSAHKHTNKFNRVPATPTPYAGLTLFESQAMKQSGGKPPAAPPTPQQQTPLVRKSISNRSLTKSTPSAANSLNDTPSAQKRSLSPSSSAAVHLSRSADSDLVESVSPPNASTSPTAKTSHPRSTRSASASASTSPTLSKTTSTEHIIAVPRQFSAAPSTSSSSVPSLSLAIPGVDQVTVEETSYLLAVSPPRNKTTSMHIPTVVIDSPKSPSSSSSSAASLHHSRKHHHQHKKST